MADKTYIHEFSLKLDVEVGSTGQWQYRSGARLNYLRSTLKVSRSVEQAILKRDFLVEFPLNATAFVGKVILDQQTDGIHWSVVAVITYGSASETESAAIYYRFFLCQGAEKLRAVVDYIETYCSEQGDWPAYQRKSPSPATIRGHQVQSVRHFTLTPMLDQKIRYQRAPLLIYPQDCTSLGHLQAISAAKSKLSGQPIAWAYNIEYPDHIDQYQAISFASEQAVQRFQQIAIAGINDETYQLLLPRLWQDLETLVKKEIKQQLHLGGVSEALYPGTPVSGAYQKPLELNVNGLLEQEIIDLYNKKTDALKSFTNSASLSKSSIRAIAENSDRQTNIVLEARANGKYWIVFDVSENSGLESAWLVPSPNLRVTVYDYENIISKLFDCGAYATEQSGFHLTKPAKVALLPNRQSWQFLEAGSLTSIEPQLETTVERA